MGNLSQNAQRVIAGLIIMIVALVLIGVIVPNLDSTIASGTYATGDRLLAPAGGCPIGTAVTISDAVSTVGCDESTSFGQPKFVGVNPVLQLLPLTLVVGLFFLGGFVSAQGIRGARSGSNPKSIS